MNKEYLEALKFIFDEALFSEFKNETHTKVRECHSVVYEALKRLEAIDNSNPSEAMECSLKLYKMVESAGNGKGFSLNAAWEYHNTIKQALLKAQEQEKVIIELCEYCGMDNLYPYDNLEKIEIAFKDKFDNYQRQRIESLGRLNKQEQVLEIIKKKWVNIAVLIHSKTVEEYNNNAYTPYNLTEEEFDTLKRWQRNGRI